MTYAIVYSSMTGNTRQLALAIQPARLVLSMR